MNILRANVWTHRGDVSADQLIVLLDRDQCSILYFLYFLASWYSG